MGLSGEGRVDKKYGVMVLSDLVSASAAFPRSSWKCSAAPLGGHQATFCF